MFLYRFARICENGRTQGGIEMFLLYLAVWFILNGRVTWEILFFGLGVSLLAYLFSCKFLDFSVKKDLRLVRAVPLVAAYCAVLVWEIFKANIAVLGFIFRLRRAPDPVLYRFESGLQDRLTKVLLANSITLTPGTITVSLEGDVFCIHCLDRSLAPGTGTGTIRNILGKMDRLLADGRKR